MIRSHAVTSLANCLRKVESDQDFFQLTDEQEVELPAKLAQRRRTDLCPESRDEPVADSRRKGSALATDLVRQNLTHVRPGHGAEREGEEDRDTEEEGHAGDAETLLRAVLVLAVDDALADESDGDGDCTKD